MAARHMVVGAFVCLWFAIFGDLCTGQGTIAMSPVQVMQMAHPSGAVYDGPASAAQCSSHGRVDPATKTCLCYEGWSGEQCERDANANGNPNCMNGVLQEDFCLCSPGYHGERCDKSICVHGLLEISDNGSPSCICEANFYGPNCDQTEPVAVPKPKPISVEAVIQVSVENFDKSFFIENMAEMMTIKPVEIRITGTSPVSDFATRIMFDVSPPEKPTTKTITPTEATTVLRAKMTAGDSMVSVLNLVSIKVEGFPTQTAGLSENYEALWKQLQTVLDRIPTGQPVCPLALNCQRGWFNTTSCVCNCPDKWTGDVCDKCVATVSCEHGSFDFLRCGCDCKDPWWGETCSQCQETECTHGGVFERSICGCNCNAPWTGRSCEVCDPSVPCHHGILNTDLCSCMCDVGWRGINCEICELNTLPVPCLNGGTVDNTTCSCACPDFYSGQQCEKYNVMKGCQIKFGYNSTTPQEVMSSNTKFIKCIRQYTQPKVFGCYGSSGAGGTWIEYQGTPGAAGVNIKAAQALAANISAEFWAMRRVSASTGNLWFGAPGAATQREGGGCDKACNDLPLFSCGCARDSCPPEDDRTAERIMVYTYDYDFADPDAVPVRVNQTNSTQASLPAGTLRFKQVELPRAGAATPIASKVYDRVAASRNTAAWPGASATADLTKSTWRSNTPSMAPSALPTAPLAAAPQSPLRDSHRFQQAFNPDFGPFDTPSFSTAVPSMQYRRSGPQRENHADQDGDRRLSSASPQQQGYRGVY